MSQLNIHMTSGFEEDLARFMRVRGLRNKSEAVRLAVRESLERAMGAVTPCDYMDWLGTGCEKPLNPEPRFEFEDELWEKSRGR